MSRGHGSTQQAILSYLQSQPREHTNPYSGGDVVENYPAWTTVQDLAYVLFGQGTPARPQVESVRRAVKRLASEGLAEIAMVRDSNHRFQLAVRPPLTMEEHAAEQATLDIFPIRRSRPLPRKRA
jgi:hypothetical protein